ncbi:MAG: ABC transporter ATP-binding protein [Bacilli bacterium]|nr:ABC transporter ATP-binding protein [Bacilli bacterium]
MNDNIIELVNIEKNYTPNEQQINGINNATVNFKRGKMYAIIGHSGSGKSTLLQIIGLLKEKTSGKYMLFNTDTDTMDESKKAQMRNKHIGFMFQEFHLDEDISTIENIMLPYYISSQKNYKEKREEILKWFKLLEIEGKEKKLPSELSTGQNAKIAFMRALVNNPEIILADEPTGNLDKDNEKTLFELLKKLAHEGKCVIVVSHSQEIKKYADTIITIENGMVKYEK